MLPFYYPQFILQQDSIGNKEEEEGGEKERVEPQHNFPRVTFVLNDRIKSWPNCITFVQRLLQDS